MSSSSKATTSHFAIARLSHMIVASALMVALFQFVGTHSSATAGFADWAEFGLLSAATLGLGIRMVLGEVNA